MKYQYAYIQSVENKNKKTSASEEYIQLATEEGGVYFFTEAEMEQAKARAAKNPEDQQLRDVEFVLSV